MPGRWLRRAGRGIQWLAATFTPDVLGPVLGCPAPAQPEGVGVHLAAPLLRRRVPPEADWFNVFVLHQNRVAHGAGGKNAVKEDLLADFLDLVVWGHEHECLADPAVRPVVVRSQRLPQPSELFHQEVFRSFEGV